MDKSRRLDPSSDQIGTGRVRPLAPMTGHASPAGLPGTPRNALHETIQLSESTESIDEIRVALRALRTSCGVNQELYRLIVSRVVKDINAAAIRLEKAQRRLTLDDAFGRDDGDHNPVADLNEAKASYYRQLQRDKREVTDAETKDER